MKQNTPQEPAPIQADLVVSDTSQIVSASEIYADLFRKYHPPALPSGLGPAWSRPGFKPAEWVEQVA